MKAYLYKIDLGHLYTLMPVEIFSTKVTNYAEDTFKVRLINMTIWDISMGVILVNPISTKGGGEGGEFHLPIQTFFITQKLKTNKS